MKGKFLLYAVLVFLLSTLASWSQLVSGGGARSGSTWSSSSSSGGSRGGGGHK